MNDKVQHSRRLRSGSMSFRSLQNCLDHNENLKEYIDRRGSLTLTANTAFPKRRGSLIAR